jgi:hypothetical protein
MRYRVRLSRPNQCTSCHGVYSRSCVIDVMSGSGTHSMNVHAAQCVPTELSATRKLSQQIAPTTERADLSKNCHLRLDHGIGGRVTATAP